MNVTQLSLQQTPPLSVPLRFFLTAPLFGLLASGLLLYQGPSLFASRWHFAILALTHTVTLGIITMVMIGAFLQILPVLAGVQIPRPRLVSTILHLLLSLGIIMLIGGLLIAYPLLIHWALLFLSLSFLLFIAIVGYCLFQVKTITPIIIAMRLALIALTVTIILGVDVGGAIISWPFTLLPLKLSPLKLTNLHLAWGLIGWIALLIIGVAYQMVPMFQITPPYPTLLTRWLAPVILTTLLIWTLLYINDENSPVTLLSTILIGIQLGVFATTTLYLQAKRLRKLPDVTLNYWRVGMVGLLITIIGWFLIPFYPSLANSPFYDILLIVLFVAGFILPVMQGMLYKIVPFLLWLHLQNQQLANLPASQAVKIPNMKQIISESWAYRQFWLYLTGLGFLISGILQPYPFIQVAGLIFICSFLLLSYNFYHALKLYIVIKPQLSQPKS